MAPSILLPSAAVDTGDAKPLRLPSSMWMFVMVFVICSAVHGWFCWNGSIVGLPRARAYFTPISRFQHPALIALGAALIALAAAVIANASGLFWSYVRTSPFRENGTAIALTMALAAAVALTGAGCFGNFKLRTLQASPFLTPKARIRKWRLIAAAAGAGFLVAFLWIQIYMALRLTSGNAVPVFWRSIHLFSGASPLVPQLLLLLGAYLWFWCNLRGVSLFGDDRPVLPRLRDLPKRDNKPMMPMFSWEVAGKAVENAALPLSASYMKRLLTTFLVVVLACGVALRGLSIRTLGEQAFGRFIFWWVCISIAVVLTDGVQMWRAWNALRELLRFLDRLALRRTLRSLKGLAWGTIWKLSGNVLEERYRATSLQFESLRHLENAMRKWIPGNAAEAQNWLAVTQKLSACRQRFDSFAIWYVSLCRGASSVTAARNADLTKPRQYQLKLASTAGAIMERILLPEWRKETESLIFDRSAERGQTENLISVAKLPLHLRAAEEFFVLPYLAFIQNSLGRIRTIAIGDLWLFLCMTLAISSYPFDPLNILGGIFLAVFLVYGGIAALVYSQMSRDATLSHITNTRPGELGWEFWERLVAFGVGPLLGLLTTLFPSLADFVFSWLQPGAQALH
jgi:hypothetical protein